MAPEKQLHRDFDNELMVTCGGIGLRKLQRWAKFLGVPVPDDYAGRKWASDGYGAANLDAYNRLVRMKEACPDEWTAFIAAERILHGS